jgi:hypothetical protein
MPTNGPHLQRLISGVTGEYFAIDFCSFLRMIDSLVQLAVISKTLSTPPGSPANGDRYIVAASPTGAWSGYAGMIVTWTTDAPTVPLGFWDVHTPNAGFLAYNLADSNLYLFDGTNWNAIGGVPVTSVFGRVGAVVAATNDYSFAQLSGSVAAGQLPNPGAASLGGIESLAATAHKWINSISTSGVPSATQPTLLDLADAPASYSGAGGQAVQVNSGATALVFAPFPVTSAFGRTGAIVAATNDYSFSQISGSVAASQLPNPGASSLGGIQSLAATAHKWINAISTSGVPGATQPSVLDLSDAPTSYSGAAGYAVQVNAGATALVFVAKPFDVSAFAPGVGTASQILLRVKLARAVTFPASATLSQASASANATGSTTFTLKQNGTSFATVNFAASASVGTWTQASDAVFAAGDLLEIDGPATADATLANVGITLAGVRA